LIVEKKSRTARQEGKKPKKEDYQPETGKSTCEQKGRFRCVMGNRRVKEFEMEEPSENSGNILGLKVGGERPICALHEIMGVNINQGVARDLLLPKVKGQTASIGALNGEID